MSDSLSILDALSRGIKEDKSLDVQKMEIVTRANSCENDSPMEPTINKNINPSNLLRMGGDIISFDVTNNDAVNDATLILGLGLVNVTGTPILYGMANASVDNALVVDGGGAGTFHMSFVSQFLASVGAIVNSIKIIGAS